MPLPRNARAKNTSSKLRNQSNHEIARKTSQLDAVCDKHKIGNLTFRSCKYATAEGKVTFVEHDHIRGNMKSGIMIVKANTLAPSDNLYDIVEIEKAKRERDEKKRQEETEKARIEIERLKTQNATNNIPEGGDQHRDLLEKLVDEDNKLVDDDNKLVDDDNKTDSNNENCVTPTEDNKDPQIESSKQILEELNDQICVEVPKETDIIEQEKSNEDISSNIVDATDNHPECSDDCGHDHNHDHDNKNGKKNKSAKAKREKAIKQMNDELAKKAKNKNGNKYFRNFMKDIRSKFNLKEEPEIKYFEVKAETTDMVIDGVKAYRISMPENTKESYFLLIGDLQMKSGLIRQIDPAYKADKVFKEQHDFLERIKAKENAKTTELTEDLLEDDEEFDDLDELGISDDETNNSDNENVPKLINNNNEIKEIEVNNVDDFLNPELLKLKKESSS
ncbi:hypothetical protein QJ856_gp1164 [Tupanvirus deep ocean]|uniref:Uncharacterized protein n=2 Tax=Tupanvirus TaxID=2094720 RepID=A0AC62A734_9VIRU|nr:hypothetical protein QJ856_gp1164 [Tupanvirus deep ocean]QKU33595.1 hypothetical protein [Tupanvirus deep ocean]